MCVGEPKGPLRFGSHGEPGDLLEVEEREEPLLPLAGQTGILLGLHDPLGAAPEFSGPGDDFRTDLRPPFALLGDALLLGQVANTPDFLPRIDCGGSPGCVRVLPIREEPD